MPNEAAAEAWLSKYGVFLGIQSNETESKRVREMCANFLLDAACENDGSWNNPVPMRLRVKVIYKGGKIGSVGKQRRANLAPSFRYPRIADFRFAIHGFFKSAAALRFLGRIAFRAAKREAGGAS